MEDGLLSTLPPDAPGQPYDRKAAVYDALVGAAWYNRLLWGADRDEYAAFARAALESRQQGWHLDAGCGSLVVTAAAYSTVRRASLLIDASVGMLRRARLRLARDARHESAPLVLLQADLLRSPLRDGAVGSALSMGLVHLFDDRQAGQLLGELRRVVAADGTLHLTSLVLGRRVGDRYLGMLHRAGEVAPPRTAAAVATLAHAHGWTVRAQRTTGSMSYLTCGPAA